MHSDLQPEVDGAGQSLSWQKRASAGADEERRPLGRSEWRMEEEVLAPKGVRVSEISTCQPQGPAARRFRRKEAIG
jgi:hypothetical protein